MKSAIRTGKLIWDEGWIFLLRSKKEEQEGNALARRYGISIDYKY